MKLPGTPANSALQWVVPGLLASAHFESAHAAALDRLEMASSAFAHGDFQGPDEPEWDPSPLGPELALLQTSLDVDALEALRGASSAAKASDPSIEAIELRRQLGSMEQAYDAKLQELAARIAHLEACLIPDAEDDQASAISNPHSRWIEGNIEEIRALGDGWAAIHPDRGVAFFTANDDDFSAYLDGLPQTTRQELLPIHTSMYRR